MIKKSTIEEIRDRMDIEEVVGDFVTLKRKGSGKYLWACCPFHDEKTPSFAITPDRGIYKCFGCGRSGDSISFIMEHDGLSYIEAIRYLASKYGIEIEETNQTDEEQEAQNEKESLYIILKFAHEYFMKNLMETEEGKSIGLSYLKERGIDPKTIRKFELGYSLSSWNDLHDYALENQFEDDLLEKAGLIVRKDEKKVYDRFRGRVMFPIHNVSGKVIAFGARTLKKDDKPKYLNSPESEVYHKSKILYGIYQARQAIRQQDNCFLVEGYTDVISMHMAGIENVVASSGTSLTNDQIKLISRFSNNITVLYDGDPAGIQASLRGIDMILESGMNVRTLVFPEGHDPDSYSRKLGSSGFAEFLEKNTRDFISFKVEMFVNEAGGDPIKKASAIKDIILTISKIPDSIKRSLYIKESAGLLEMDESVLITELNKILVRERRKQPREDFTPPPDFTPDIPDSGESALRSHDELIAIQERECLRLLIRYGTRKDDSEAPMYQYSLGELEEVEFVTPSYEQIFSLYRSEIAKGNTPDTEFLLRNCGDDLRKDVIDLLADRHEASENWFKRFKIFVPAEEDLLDKMFMTNMARLKRSIVQKLIDEHKEKLKGVTDPEEIDQLLHVQQELKKAERELADLLGIVVPK